MVATAHDVARHVKSPSVVEHVIAELRRGILLGTLRPGQEFSLRETAAHLGVSTAPIREALRVLQGEGLIVARRARSAVVAPMDADDLASIYRLRRLIEPDLAARSCALLTSQDLAILDGVALSFGDDTLGIDEIYEPHRQFHLALLRAAGPWDLRIIETLWHAAERYVRIGFGKLDPKPSERRRRARAHHDVIEAFRTRDPEAACAAIHDHLDESERIARESMASKTQS